MADVSVCALGPSPAPGDARGNVYLLAVDSISDLHSTPLDTETPQVTSDAHGEKSMSAPLDKTNTPSAERPAARSRCGLPCMNTLLTFLIVIALVNMSLLLYILHLYRNQDSLLHTLIEKFDAQIDPRIHVNHEFNGPSQGKSAAPHYAGTQQSYRRMT